MSLLIYRSLIVKAVADLEQVEEERGRGVHHAGHSTCFLSFPLGLAHEH